MINATGYAALADLRKRADDVRVRILSGYYQDKARAAVRRATERSWQRRMKALGIHAAAEALKGRAHNEQ